MGRTCVLKKVHGSTCIGGNTKAALLVAVALVLVKATSLGTSSADAEKWPSFQHSGETAKNRKAMRPG